MSLNFIMIIYKILCLHNLIKYYQVSYIFQSIQSFKNWRSNTNKIVTSRPGKAYTWQSPCTFKWNLVSQAPFKDPQGNELIFNLINYPKDPVYAFKKNFCRKFGRTLFKIQVSPCPKKTIYRPHPHQWEALILIVLKYHNIILRPNSYVGGRQNIWHLFLHIVHYNIKLNKDTYIMR